MGAKRHKLNQVTSEATYSTGWSKNEESLPAMLHDRTSIWLTRLISIMTDKDFTAIVERQRGTDKQGQTGVVSNTGVICNIGVVSNKNNEQYRCNLRCVLRESSCLHYLLTDKRDSSITDKLRHTKIFKPLPTRTVKFRQSFVPHCLCHYD